MLGSSLPPVVGGLMSYLLYLCIFPHSDVQHILCCVFVSLECSFLIDPSVFSNVNVMLKLR